jgi:hypothetical protein
MRRYDEGDTSILVRRAHFYFGTTYRSPSYGQHNLKVLPMSPNNTETPIGGVRRIAKVEEVAGGDLFYPGIRHHALPPLREQVTDTNQCGDRGRPGESPSANSLRPVWLLRSDRLRAIHPPRPQFSSDTVEDQPGRSHPNVRHTIQAPSN